MFTLRFLGGATLEGPDGPVVGAISQRLRLGLLARLAAADQDGIGREKLLALFWPESSPARARHALSNALYAIRRALGDEAVQNRGDLVLIPRDSVRIDLWDFRDALAVGDLESGTAAYAGPFLDGVHLNAVEFERWADHERDAAAREFGDALIKLATGAESEGDWSSAATCWKRAAAHDPLSSRVAQRLMQALSAAGDPAAALRHARIHGQLLETELDSRPDTAVEALADDIRQGRLSPEPQAVGPLRPSPTSTSSSSSSSQDPAPDPNPAPSYERAPPRSVAVLPFVPIHPDPETEIFSDGITEETIYSLSLVQDLHVVARTSSFAWKGTNQDVRRIAERLGVRAVLEGSVRRSGTRIRVTAQLIEAETGYHLWSGRYDRELVDVLYLQDEIASQIAACAKVELGSVAGDRHSTDARAYDAYLRARHALARFDREGIDLAIEALERAIEIDPDYAEAHSALAECHTTLGVGLGIKSRPKRVAAAKAALERAMALDRAQPAVHLNRGLLAMWNEWDAEEAETAFNAALKLNPNFADAYVWHALLLCAYGIDLDRATEQTEKALHLDPLGMKPRLLKIHLPYFNGDYETAGDLAKAYADEADDVAFVQYVAADALLNAGRLSEVRNYLDRAIDIGGRTSLVTAAEGHLGALTENAEVAVAAVDTLRDRGSHGLCAGVLSRLGELDSALQELDKAVEARESTAVYALSFPEFEAIRGDPRFGRVLEKMGLAN